MFNFHVVTLFPEFFQSPLETSLLGRARSNGILNFTFHNPRDYGLGLHRHVDDRPFGGGPGMVMRLEPLLQAVNSIENSGPLILLSPAGKQFDQKMAQCLALESNLTLICGRYEGIDNRLTELLPMAETSLCPAVLNGGESAALAIIEAVARLLPGFLGKMESCETESFSENLLEAPQYTRPESYANLNAPQILLSGNHAEIAKWKRQHALARTLAKNPDLLAEARLTEKDVGFLAAIPRERPGRMMSFCLCHEPVWLEGGKSGCSSLTNLDVHDIGRISRSYGMGPFFVLHPLEDQRAILNAILAHWQNRENGHEDRKRALNLVCPLENFEQVENFCLRHYGMTPCWVVTSASWPKANEPMANAAQIRQLCRERPVIICLGTSRGLDLGKLPFKFVRMAPIRYLDENHLPVRAAAAIIADRILGDFF